ncbi:L-histidine N(alpha)-methyltransferase [Pontibacter sp. JH31]|uniref:L-histidine N(Alpha)-methyltransferase n=1 Tax=Pontibacter aquaedesilientis TaxID=2766980 RepID=A0ABR7XDD3_9BACT|nr:L-histidine N(alpha)-methyltransferase [Pontibacter aquaedesilientis]MBD1396309.1 L-histidine N(alpha)-methyltransferase [Pontibacter aquaedesilientis]
MLQDLTQHSLIDLSRKDDGSRDTAAFAHDVATGLSLAQKKLPSRYFYDAKGSRLFQQIMELPEYYLTRAEFEVLNTHRQAMASHFAAEGFFHLVDLGAGDALKTKLLLRELTQRSKDFDYIPIDISGDAMVQLTGSLQEEIPGLQVQAVVGEYIQALEWLHHHKTGPKVVLFLGSNIGNFEPEEGIVFLQRIRQCLDPGDKLLLGVDLRKNPDTILKAYDDAAGITAAFNLNLLHRINRELGGDFKVDQFRHFALYDPQAGAMKSYLVSEEAQEVYLKSSGERYKFEAWEAIHTENSHKFTLNQVEEMALLCGFKVDTVYQDKNEYFADIVLDAS